MSTHLVPQLVAFIALQGDGIDNESKREKGSKRERKRVGERGRAECVVGKEEAIE